MRKVVVVDYGRGNLRSVQKALELVGLDAKITREPRDLDDAHAVVLPGVGAFRDCMKSLVSLGLVNPLVRAIERGKPFLGICLGLQILFDESEEFGPTPGLGLLAGQVRRFPSDRDGLAGLKIPHMGWNTVDLTRESPLFRGIPAGAHFYFVHSYFVEPCDRDVVLGLTEYGVSFASVVQKDRLVATQFHPEKSQNAGLRFLANFRDWISHD
jgi:glutamine amidotransferase